MTAPKHPWPEGPEDKELFKSWFKEALKEWLNDQFATFGKWTLAGILAAAFVGLIYLALVGDVWRK